MMAKDPIGDRFGKRLDDTKRKDAAQRTRTSEDIESEEELIANTPKVEPIKSEGQTKRNDPCPCGSGKKFKKCCGRED